MIAYSQLSGGAHTFRVRAIDSKSFVDTTPATHTWTVDSAALDVSIQSGPDSSTTSRQAIFTFSGSVGVSGFECALDGTDFTDCTSPQQYSDLANGEHTFKLRGKDAADNRGSIVDYSRTVENKPPVVADQSVSTNAGQPVAITLSATDENDDALTYTVDSAPAHGTLSGTAPNLTYTPDSGFVGQDSFTFTVSDGHGGSATATVTITVTGEPDEPEEPGELDEPSDDSMLFYAPIIRHP